MKKDFDSWNELKKKIEENTHDVHIKEWEIWWSTLGLNIGSESCGKWPEFRRPVLIIKRLSHSTCFVIPLSTKIKTWTWFADYKVNGVKYTALLYQLRMIHTNRLTKFELKLERSIFLEIKKRLKYLLNL
jgi:mRNA interferase MazF